MFKILVAEDDNSARRLLCEVLSGYGYETIPAVDGAQALELLQAHHADLIVLDVMMPRMDGLQLTRRLREEGYTTPILMLTARETTQDKCRGFLSGADDYVVKPVDEEELALRIAALLRRSQIASERKIVVGDVTLSYDTQSVTRGEESVELPKKEFLLLFKLLSSPGKIFTKRQLMQEIWEDSSGADEHTIEVHVGRLRERLKRFDEFEIVTMRGLGYKAVKKV